MLNRHLSFSYHQHDPAAAQKIHLYFHPYSRFTFIASRSRSRSSAPCYVYCLAVARRGPSQDMVMTDGSLSAHFLPTTCRDLNVIRVKRDCLRTFVHRR
jgi:hypothetical protein